MEIEWDGKWNTNSEIWIKLKTSGRIYFELYHSIFFFCFCIFFFFFVFIWCIWYIPFEFAWRWCEMRKYGFSISPIGCAIIPRILSHRIWWDNGICTTLHWFGFCIEKIELQWKRREKKRLWTIFEWLQLKMNLNFMISLLFNMKQSSPLQIPSTLNT